MQTSSGLRLDLPSFIREAYKIKESYSAGGGEWRGYLTSSHDRGKVTSTGRTTNQYWSP